MLLMINVMCNKLQQVFTLARKNMSIGLNLFVSFLKNKIKNASLGNENRKLSFLRIKF